MAYKKKQYKIKQLLLVEWQDASGGSTWTWADQELELGPFLIHNIGWFMGYSVGDCLVMSCQEDMQSARPGMVSHIPCGMIKRVKELKRGYEF